VHRATLIRNNGFQRSPVPIDLQPLFDNSPTFRTSRLTLRPINETDLSDLYIANSDPEVTRYLPYPPWQSMDDANAWYARTTTRFADKIAAQFAIRIDAHNGEAARTIGNALLFQFDVQHEVAEIGYVIAREHWGKGYTSEAMRPLIDYAFNALGFHRLEAKLDPRNLASAKVLTKLGFVHEGTRRENWLDHNGRADTGLYGLLRGEWRTSA
jgi:[ribosomal protein S5]-alanine N-acetyltransferase